jgi:molybdate transport system substrate-binding protein
MMAGKVRVAAEIPTDTPIVYPVALIKDRRNGAAAEAFMKLLASDAARGVFARHGFSQP